MQSWSPGPAEWAALREDVGYIRAKVERIPELEERTRKLEKRIWGVPGSLLVALLAAFGIHAS